MTSNRKLPPRVIHKFADDGAAVVLVEITNRRGRFATLDLSDWNEWCAARSCRLFLNDTGNGYQYVRASSDKVRGSLASVARELVAPGRGRIVSYLDGDRLNLRRKNLFVQQGHAPGATPVAAV